MTPRTTYPDCYKCGGHVESREDQAVVRFDDEEILFQRVPLGVCAGCGERFLTAKAARLMERALVLCRPPSRLTPGEIRAFRDALGISRETLASRLGVSAQTVFRWETGRSKPPPASLRRLETLRKRSLKDRRAG
jgi:YgiT-type zinc finger domain-containing protein